MWITITLYNLHIWKPSAAALQGSMQQNLSFFYLICNKKSLHVWFCCSRATEHVVGCRKITIHSVFFLAKTSMDALHDTQKHSSVFTVCVNACTWPRASLPDMGKKYSVLLKKVPCMCTPPCPCYIMGLLMAGIIIGPVYASLKIWFRTPTVCGIYVSEENRRGVWITSCFYDSPEPM